MSRKYTKRNRKTEKKKRSKRKSRGVGLRIIPEIQMSKLVTKRLKKLLQNRMIEKELYDCILDSGEILPIVEMELRRNRRAEVETLVKKVLTSSCNYVDNTVEILEQDIKANLPNEFYECLMENDTIKRTVEQELRKKGFRTISELLRILEESSDCYHIDI